MQPNYSTYTLDELIDVESHIDKVIYPERYKQVCEQITLKQNDPKVADEIKLNGKVAKVNRLLYLVAFFWFFAFFTLLTGEFRIKGYSAYYEDNTIGFFCGVVLYFSLGLLIYIKYLNQSRKITSK